MAMTIRTGMLGLLGLWGLWGCGGTATHGDTDASDTDASESTNGTDGDGSGDFGSGNGSTDGSGGNSSGGVGGNDSTSGDGSGGAATTRGSGSRNNSASGTSSGSSGDSSASASASSGGGASSGSSSGSGSGGQVAVSAVAATSVGFTASTGTGTVGIGGFGGDTVTVTTGSPVGTTSGVTTGSITGSVTSTTGSSTTGSSGPPELDEFPYLEECDASYWYFSRQYCNLGFTCPATSGWVNCWDDGNGNVSCECGRESSWGNYQLFDASTVDACAYAASACVAGPDAEQDQPTCTPSSLYQSTSYCNATATCETKVNVEGANVVKTGWHYVYCDERTDGWNCDCEVDYGRVSVTLDTSSGAADMCIDALDWCSGDITREGPRECSPVSQYAGTNSCYVNLRCTQAAVAGGVPASVTENYSLSCGKADDGKWVCDCPGVGNFDVEADTGWDACTLGAAECTPM